MIMLGTCILGIVPFLMRHEFNDYPVLQLFGRKRCQPILVNACSYHPFLFNYNILLFVSCLNESKFIYKYAIIQEVDGDLEDLDALVRLSSGSHRMTPTVAPSAAGIASSSTLKRPAATSLDLGIVKKPKPATIDDVGKGGRKAVQKPTNTTINKPLAKPPLVAALNLLGDYDDEDAEDGEP